jgi:trehalose/maltose hydrolase-like predicted phosphorylase
VPNLLQTRFEALIFDWDGTAVPDRTTDASKVRALVEELCAHGMYIGIVSGTHVGNVDGQLLARPDGPGELLLALNRGSEIFKVDRDGPQLVAGREATPAEDLALDKAAEETVRVFAARGLRTEVVSTRLNRRKIDLIPEPAWSDPPKAIIDRLLDAVIDRLDAAGVTGLADAVAIAEDAARRSGLVDARVTSDVKHVEIGLTDKSDSAHWLFRFLAEDRGIGPGLVLIGGDEFGSLGSVPGSDSWMLVSEAARATAVSVGVEPTGTPEAVLHLGGGPERFIAVLADQLDRRRRGDIPRYDEDTAWSVTFEGLDPERERAVEACLTLSDGHLGSRGTPRVPRALGAPMVVAAGIYDGVGSRTHLLACPTWQHVTPVKGQHDQLRRVLDMRTGLVHESHLDGKTTRRSVMFSSLARKAAVVLRAEAREGTTSEAPALEAPADRTPVDTGTEDDAMWMRIAASSGGVTVAASQRAYPQGSGGEVLERLGAYVADVDTLPGSAPALDHLRDLDAAGFDHLLDEHRRAWARRWHAAKVTIGGDEALQLAVRFNLFHLLGAAADEGEAAVGARGLTGDGYRGHVFWDTDVFVVPVLTATDPAAARAVLEYRIRRLPAALAAAAAEGQAGARFPWESAGAGSDVTPRQAKDLTGRVVPIETGIQEIHIVGCVAWAAAHYLAWTGDDEFAAGPGGELIVETARYWASRLQIDPQGAAHLRGVVGPDEYHVMVDDNAFTNVLARWNLRRAAELERPEVTDEERTRWLRLADAIVVGYDPVTKRYEQFTGFFGLEPLVIAELAPRRPIAADLLLGVERVKGAQILKQADVLMLHHLLPDEVAAGSLIPNLDYYEPRTAHGSTLSPGIHASLMARAGRPEDALSMLNLAARIDLDDISATTAGGLHFAAMASVWHALAFGFLGVRVIGDALGIDPAPLPVAWSELTLHLRYRKSCLVIRAEGMRLAISTDLPLDVVVGGNRFSVDAGGLSFRRSGTGWHRDDTARAVREHSR